MTSGDLAPSRFLRRPLRDRQDLVTRNPLLFTLFLSAVIAGPFTVLVMLRAGSVLAGLGFHAVVLVPNWLWARRLLARERAELGLPPVGRNRTRGRRA